VTTGKVDLGDLVKQADLRHYATKEDLANLKVWLITITFGAAIAVGGIVVAILRLWK
jgi:hypothetical protein